MKKEDSMEALIELILEIVFELFGEIILEFGSALFAHFSSYFNTNTRAKRILKYSIAGIVFSATLILLILALIYKKTIYVGIVTGYFLLLLVTYILKFINKNICKNTKFDKTITWINRSIHYAFPVVLIVLASLNINKATPVIIILSSITLIVYLCINIYRLQNMNRRDAYKKFQKRYAKKSASFKEQNHPKQFLNFLSVNKDHYIKFLQKDATVEDLKLLKGILADLSRYYDSKLFLEVVEEAQERFQYYELEDELRSEKLKMKKIDFRN